MSTAFAVMKFLSDFSQIPDLESIGLTFPEQPKTKVIAEEIRKKEQEVLEETKQNIQ